MKIQGKTAVITGGAKRVGRAITLALAQSGANVVINYNSSADLAKTVAEEAAAFGVEAMTYQADVSSHEQVSKMAEAALGRFGTVDIVVNNSSYYKKISFPTDDIELWQRTTGILINGAFYVSNAFAPGMLEKGEGAIVNILDLSVWEAWPGFMAHAVGKTGLWALTRQLALELAPTVRTNAVAPGPVLPPTDFDADKIQRTANKTLLDRWGKPEDVANTVAFLVEADYITGECIAVDGGQRYGHRKHEEG